MAGEDKTTQHYKLILFFVLGYGLMLERFGQTREQEIEEILYSSFKQKIIRKTSKEGCLYLNHFVALISKEC